MKNRNLILLIILGIILRLFLSVQTYSGDINNHIAWGKDAITNGFSGMYQRDFYPIYGTLTPTYPPVPIFLFTFCYLLFISVYRLAWVFNLKFPLFPSSLIFFLEDQDVLPAFMKIPAIVSDIILALIIFTFVRKIFKSKKSQIPLIASSLILFNPAFFYNSSYWGQIEAIPLVFIMGSFYMLIFSKKSVLTAFLFAIAILTKQTSIVFIPVFAMVYLYKFGLIKALNGLLFNLFIFWLSFLPFYQKGNILTFALETYWNKIQTGSGSSFVTDHAFNFWALVSGLGKIPDSEIWFVFSYRSWGYFIFFILAGIILLHLFNVIINDKTNEKVLFAAFLISGAAFLFLTRMHERYLLQALPFLLLIGIKKRSYLFGFIFLSLFYVINLYHNWWAPRINILVDIISSSIFIDSLIVVVIFIFTYYYLDYMKVIRRFSIRSPFSK